MNDALPAEYSGFRQSNIDEGKRMYDNYIAGLKKRWPQSKIDAKSRELTAAEPVKGVKVTLQSNWKKWEELSAETRKAFIKAARDVSEETFYPPLREDPPDPPAEGEEDNGSEG